MNFLALPVAYFIWHYSRALRELYLVWSNFLWYVIHLFSIPLLFGTLFSPWKRMTESGKGGGLEGFAEALVINTLSRLVGFLIRVPVITLGCLLVVGMVVGLVLLYVLWVLLPLIVVLLIHFGVSTLYV